MNNSTKKSLTKETKLIIFSVVCLLAGAFLIYKITQKENDGAKTVDASAIPNLTRDFNHKTGPDSAKVKIVEFYDPECEACAAFYPYVKDILNQYKSDIQLTVRYALYHGNSVNAAKVLEASARQNKFWEMMEILLTRQNEWSHKQEIPTANFNAYAQELQLDPARFNQDINDLSIMNNVSIDIADGKTIGINGTPTIFINGKRLERLHPTAFKEMVENELKAQ